MKVKSKAYLEAEAERDQMHKGLQKIVAKDLSCVVYFGFNAWSNSPVFTGYYGRALKPAMNYRYNTVEARNKAMQRFIEGAVKHASTRRKREPRALFVGDVLVSSWGYEQTNIDYYLVVKLIGASSASIVSIGAMSKDTLFMQGKVIPNVNNITGEPFTVRVDGESVKMDFKYASKKHPIEVIQGVKVWGADHFTSYA